MGWSDAYVGIAQTAFLLALLIKSHCFINTCSIRTEFIHFRIKAKVAKAMSCNNLKSDEIPSSPRTTSANIAKNDIEIPAKPRAVSDSEKVCEYIPQEGLGFESPAQVFQDF